MRSIFAAWSATGAGSRNGDASRVGRATAHDEEPKGEPQIAGGQSRRAGESDSECIGDDPDTLCPEPVLADSEPSAVPGADGASTEFQPKKKKNRRLSALRDSIMDEGVRISVVQKVSEATVNYADARLQKFEKHACLLALMIILMGLGIQLTLMAVFRSSSCKNLITVVSNQSEDDDEGDSGDSMPTSLKELGETGGVTIYATYFIVSFNFEGSSFAIHADVSGYYDKGVTFSDAYSTTVTSPDDDGATISSGHLYYGSNWEFTSNFEPTVTLSNTALVACQQEGIDYEWKSTLPEWTDENECTYKLQRVDGIWVLDYSLYDTSDAWCWVNSCGSEYTFLLGTQSIMVEYESCTTWAAAFGIAGGYAGYIDLGVTAFVITCYLIWKSRRERKNDVVQLVGSVVSAFTENEDGIERPSSFRAVEEVNEPRTSSTFKKSVLEAAAGVEETKADGPLDV